MRIYCVKYGHASFGTTFFGYVYCGRCDEQIGDMLGSVFSEADSFAFVGCKESPCKVCDPIIAKLNSRDKKIYETLKTEHEKNLGEKNEWYV